MAGRQRERWLMNEKKDAEVEGDRECRTVDEEEKRQALLFLSEGL